MPDLVFNTGPVIALTAAVESLVFLNRLYDEILIPFEVLQELEAGGADCPELAAIRGCSVFRTLSEPVDLPILLRSQLDVGEASVIQNALIHNVSTVVIDEKLGRRMARLHELRVTGSIGILVKAARAGLVPQLDVCFQRMRSKGVWVSKALEKEAILAVQADSL
jgi:predicted nucleic acid-binding protein